MATTSRWSLFAGGPWEVNDDIARGARLVVMSYDGVVAGAAVESAPDLIKQIFLRKNAEGSAFRQLRNKLLFVVADEDKVVETHRLEIVKVYRDEGRSGAKSQPAGIPAYGQVGVRAC